MSRVFKKGFGFRVQVSLLFVPGLGGGEGGKFGAKDRSAWRCPASWTLLGASGIEVSGFRSWGLGFRV